MVGVVQKEASTWRRPGRRGLLRIVEASSVAALTLCSAASESVVDGSACGAVIGVEMGLEILERHTIPVWVLYWAGPLL
jgi:hypothetical protein